MNKINLKFVDLNQDQQFQQKRKIMFVQNQYRSRQHYTLLKKIKKQRSNSNIKEQQLIKSLDVRLPLKNNLDRIIDRMKQKETPKKIHQEGDQRSSKFKTQSSPQQKDNPYKMAQLYKIKRLKKLEELKYYNQNNKLEILINQSQYSDIIDGKSKTQQLSDVLRLKIQQQVIKRSKSSERNLPIVVNYKKSQKGVNEGPIFLRSGHMLKGYHPLNKKLKVLRSKRQQLLKIPIKELKVQLSNQKS